MLESRNPQRSIAAAAAAAALGALAACGGSGAPADPGTETEGQFIVFESAFENFRRWPSFPLPDSAELGVVHLAGPKTDYLNMRPPAGSSEFPKGTIIVKEVEVNDIPDRQVFALVKRGGGYDAAQGAPGWEWFELKNDSTGLVPSIVWRGYGPPPGSGELYGGDPHACIDCHTAAKSNDYIQSPPLQLANF